MTLPYFGIALARERLAPTHVGRAVTLARIYDPLEAVQAGFLDEAVDESAFAAQVNVIASQLSALDMKAYRETKARNREALNASLDGAFERELGAVE
jgi:enoyl-CoA hydratase